jgi:hypothetical protein
MSLTQPSSRRLGVAVALCLLGGAPPAALAQSPSQAGYGETPVVALPRSTVDPNAGSGRLASADVSGLTPARGSPSETTAPSAAPALAPAASNADGFGASAERLPFTGLDLAVITLIAVALLACGVGLRRTTRAL